MYHPEVVERLAILNVPHPRRMLAGLRTLRQLRRSWYIAFFQLPFVPERLASLRDFAALKRPFGDARPGAFTDEDLRRYSEAWSQPGALTAMLAYYRATTRRTPKQSLAALRPVTAPTRVIWGEQDRHLGAELAEPLRKDVPNLERVVRLPQASHWVQHDEPDRVNELLVEFFRG
jgi:pimeloyl-ACP methyl ester carboxylesterase